MPEILPGRVRVLMIDDDVKLCRLLGDYLRPLGFDLTAVHDGLSGVARALDSAEGTRPNWDAVILDVMLPGIDGFEALRRIRKRSDVPILMLTARGDETDRIVGLEVGADDYVPKTFSSRELLARLRAVMRRGAARFDRPDGTGPAGSPEQLDHLELHVNLAAREARLADAALPLTPVEFDLLVCLLRAKGRIKTREALLDEIRDRHYDVFDRSIDVHISALRRKLGDDARTPRFIRTVRSAGYMMPVG